ncbi:uncharacterized protein J4E87_003978 [Alternaria ethzedia]|uniref:uncharacterized protein n=1 Tax=Alternaria ethzedia TaxID=181014 RepID=UPI0020C48D13|nr:uncharacterized protein J4E87_003978 [Alternaria ethzedia]KAI4627415.1 hypothetical protein J4E87_003978 [Alternaria ethzedia]
MYAARGTIEMISGSGERSFEDHEWLLDVTSDVDEELHYSLCNHLFEGVVICKDYVLVTLVNAGEVAQETQALDEGICDSTVMASSNENYPQGPYEVGKHIVPPPRPSSPSTAEYRLNHLMTRIKDPEKSLKFYCDCLGMHVVFIFNAGPFTIYYLGPRDSGMSTLGTSKGLLELYYIPADAATSYTSGNDYSNPAGIGFGHIGFTVPDVPEALERIKSFGYEVIKPLDEAKEEQMGLPAEAVEGKHGTVQDGYKHVFKQLAFVKDPDGYWVEIVPQVVKPPSDTPVKVLRLGVDGFISSPLIKVLVGPESQRSELFVHQSIITSRSKFSANALSGRWNNSDAKTINLYDVDPELRLEDVEHYLETVYTGRISLTDGSEILESICHVYVIAELLLDVHTRNLATHCMSRSPTVNLMAKAAQKGKDRPLLYHLDKYLEDDS